MGHRQLPVSDADTKNVPSIEENFALGKYSSVAMQGDPTDWRTYAAYGLVGKCTEAIEGLRKFRSEEPQFYLAVAHWMAGDDDQAVRLLEPLRADHARNLLALIRKPQIRVLGQLPWRREDPQDLVSGASDDPKFMVTNISFHPADKRNHPYANIHDYYDRDQPPDFYICQMVEWHVIAPNIQELPCPIFGQSADYDLHIQAVYPWLQLFDELVVTDETEWEDVSRLVNVPVSTFPKSFGLPHSLPSLPNHRRDLDFFWSGTVKHVYHEEKIALLLHLLASLDLNILVVDGRLHPSAYYSLLEWTKAVFTYYRHSGGMVTRGLEALAMGCGLVVQRQSVLSLYVGEEHGVLTYETPEELTQGLQRIAHEWSEFQFRARHGAQHVREEFSLRKTASQYLRYLTFLAAKPRSPRRVVDRKELRQKRSVLCKGWFPDDLTSQEALVRENIDRWISHLSELRTPHLIIDTARELILWAFYISDTHNMTAFFPRVLNLYRQGMEKFPQSLVLRVNFIRVALQFGGPGDVDYAIGVARELLQLPEATWQVDPMEDVFPYDFLSASFDYRTYFDTVMQSLMQSQEGQRRLVRILLASVHYHLGHYEQAEQHFKQAMLLNPEFSVYRLRYAQLIVKHGRKESFEEAAELLIPLVKSSVVAEEAYDLLEQLHQEQLITVPDFSDLAKTAIRLRRCVHRYYGLTFPTDKSLLTPRLQYRSSGQETRNTVSHDRPNIASHVAVSFADKRDESKSAVMPAISCLVVSHNKPHYLVQAVQSLLDQTFEKWEAIIMDSGVLYDQGYFDQQPWKDDSRIHIVKSGETPEMRRTKAMAPWCWNECHRRGLVRGELVVYLCDDDLWYPNAFQVFVDFFQAHPCAMAMYASEDHGYILPSGEFVSLGERRATSVGGRACQGRVMDCQVDYLQFCHRKKVLDLFSSNEYWPESLDTQSHADGVFMERVGAYVPIYPHDVKVGLNRRTPQSTYLPTEQFLSETGTISLHHQPIDEKDSEQHSNRETKTFTCSIIMPIYNRADLTRNCLTRLAEVTHGVEYEIILVDNGSTDETPAFLATLGGDVRILRNESNLGFAKACNQGARVASGRYLVFLNNDTLPQHDWLLELVKEVERDRDIAVVGSKLLYPNGTIQHAGLVFTRKRAIPYHLYRHSCSQDGDPMDRRRELQAVTGACMLIRREIFETVGGFDEQFRNGFEDVDLCLRVRERGWKIVYQPKSWLYHLEGQTTGRKDYDKQNIILFQKKWNHRWLGDQDLVMFEDGIADVTTSENASVLQRLQDRNKSCAESQEDALDSVKVLARLTTEEERRAWSHVAQLQRLLLQMPSKTITSETPHDLVASLRSVLSRSDDWPQNDLVSIWAASVCTTLNFDDEAEAFWARALRLGDSRPSRLGLARLSLKRGHFDEARRHIAELLKKDPPDEEAWHIHGVGLLQAGDFARSAEAFERAGRRIASLKGLGMAYVGLNHHREAFHVFLDVLKKYPDDVEALNWLLRAGTALEWWENLAAHLSAFLARNPANCDFRFALAGVYLRAGRMADAVHEYTTLTLLSPDYDGLEDLAAALHREEHGPMVKAEPVSG